MTSIINSRMERDFASAMLRHLVAVSIRSPKALTRPCTMFVSVRSGSMSGSGPSGS